MSSEQVRERRTFLKQAAAVVWATPVILTLASERALAQGISCCPTGSACGNWVEELGTCVQAQGVICCGTCVHIPGTDFCGCDGVLKPIDETVPCGGTP